MPLVVGIGLNGVVRLNAFTPIGKAHEELGTRGDGHDAFVVRTDQIAAILVRTNQVLTHVSGLEPEADRVVVAGGNDIALQCWRCCRHHSL